MSDTEPQTTPLPPRRRATLRLSQRELTRISLGVILIIVGSLGFLGYRAILGFRSSHDILIAKQNLHMLHEAFYNYAQDWDNRLPPAERWTDAISGYISSMGQAGGHLAALHGPCDSGTVGYVYNDLAAGLNIESGKREGAKDKYRKNIDPSRLILLIERPGVEENVHVLIPPQGNPEGEAALLKQLAFPHGSDDTESASTVVLYADGSHRVWTRHDFKP